jgi:hypothetical protein
MSRVFSRTVGACVGLVVALGWTSPSLAQESAPAATTATTANDPAAAPASPEGPGTHAREGAGLILMGFVTFGLSYVPAVTVGSQSALPADRQLSIPVAGPWMDLMQRPSCPVADCNADPGNRTLLVLDGFFQALSMVELLAGLAEISKEYSVPEAKVEAGSATVRFTPARVAGGYGMSAIGTF